MLVLPAIVVLVLLLIARKNQELGIAIMLLLAIRFGLFPNEIFHFPGLFKYTDFIILSFIIWGFTKPKYGYLIPTKQMKIAFAIYVFVLLFSFVNSLNYQPLNHSVRLYRHFLWFMLPFALSRIIQTEKSFLKLIRYIYFIGIITGSLYILKSFFPSIPVMDYCLILGKNSFMARVYSGYELLPITGFISLNSYFLNKKKVYLYILLVASIGVLITLGRSFITGYLIGLFFTTYFALKHYQLNFKGLIQRILFFIFAFFILYLSPLGNIVENRMIDTTQEQLDENMILTGRWDRFLIRLEWLKNQPTNVVLFGPGLIYPGNLHFPMEIDPGLTEVYIAAESEYLNNILAFGIIGFSLFVLALLLFLKSGLRLLKEQKNKMFIVIYLSSLIAFLFNFISDNIDPILLGIILFIGMKTIEKPKQANE